MQILFAGFPITPYYRDFVNRLQTQGDVRVINVRSAGDEKHVGAGVKLVDSQIEFRDVKLRDRCVSPRRLLKLSDFELSPGYDSFVALDDLIREISPDVIVVNEPYHAAFAFDRAIVAAVRQTKSKTVFQSIPFQLSTFQEALAAVQVPPILPMRSIPSPLRVLAQTLGIDKLYLKLVRKKSLFRRVHFLRKTFHAADAHAVYYEGGIETYGSYGVPAERIRVVRNSPNTEELLQAADRHPSCDHGYRLIHVGRLVKWKRVDLLIRAVATLRSHGFANTDLVIVGNGPCEESLRAMAAEFNVEDAVHFRGGVYEADQLAQEFAASSIYVLAGMGGLSLNEAMCFSVPVVCCRCDGTEKFLIREGVNGMYFREGDEANLVDTLQTLFSDSALRKRMGHESRRIIEEELNTQIHVLNYLRLFNDLNSKCLNT